MSKHAAEVIMGNGVETVGLSKDITLGIDAENCLHFLRM